MTINCYHVTTMSGDVYGVACTNKRDAMGFVQDRIRSEGGSDHPKSAEKVGTWDADYGTVLAY